jgi:short-subunit dehydrogenase
VGIPYSAVYVASKHAVNGLVKSMRYELRGTGVHVWAACPGRTESEFSEKAMGARGDTPRLPQREPTARVVRSILRGLDRPRAFLIPSWTAWAGLVFADWCPALFERFIVRWANRHVGSALEPPQSEQGQSVGEE